MPKRSQSSQRWLARQRRDGFAKAARREGRVSRAYFKLAQLDERFRLVRAPHWVLELGAAPGGWTQYLQERVTQGRIIAVDLLPLAVSGARLVPITRRFGEAEANRRIEAALAEAPRTPALDLVLSDMAPNISGVRAADQAAVNALADLAAAAAAKWLATGGGLVVKLMQGDGCDAWVQAARPAFDQLTLAKPAASRAGSRETYAVALGYRGTSQPLARGA